MPATSVSSERLDASEFERLREVLVEYCGLRVPREMKTLVEAHVRRRTKILALSGMAEYCRRLTAEWGRQAQWENELVHLVDQLTSTAETAFPDPGEAP